MRFIRPPMRETYHPVRFYAAFAGHRLAMAEDEGPEVSPDAGPPATGERSDRRTTVPGVELPNSPERSEATPEDKEGTQPPGDAPDEGAAREREDDRR